MIGGGIAVPGVDDGAGDATVLQSLVQRSLIDRWPAARRRMFSAMVCLRRLIVPLVHPDMWGVITTFGNSWNANFEGRTLG